jgi:hypothetical protein
MLVVECAMANIHTRPDNDVLLSDSWNVREVVLLQHM